ncbi:MAG: hypothetical protein ACRD0V_18375 [Acidimicrobiales bacterium]
MADPPDQLISARTAVFDTSEIPQGIELDRAPACLAVPIDGRCSCWRRSGGHRERQ